MRKKAVFLDRDGVLCEDTDYITCFEKMHLYEFAKEAVEQIHQKGYLAIVVTNQSGVARKMMSEDMVKQLNQYLMQETGVDAVYYCPHLPPEKEEISPYRVFCICRKPEIGMLLKAQQKYQLELQDCWMVGDRISDIQTGKKAGCKTCYITEQPKKEIQSDIQCKNLLKFSNYL